MLGANEEHQMSEEYVVEETLEELPLENQTDFLDEEPETSSDFGGMDSAMYSAIVEFKKYGTYPTFARSMDTRSLRIANCHWRTKCARFMLSESDNETLLYYNQNNTSDEPKIVVKKGEVKRIIERIHELIGHLGMKRTQYSVMRKLYWRSVRQDVRNIVNSCEFCVNKKVEGKKIMKAPVDIMGDEFDLSIIIRSMEDIMQHGGDRLIFSLKGIDEHEVRMAAQQRMTTYTFKETATDRPARLQHTSFRRQPYMKRSRFSSASTTGFLLPFNGPGEYSKKQNNFIEVFHHDILPANDFENLGPQEVGSGELIEEVIEEVIDDSDFAHDREQWNVPGPSTAQKRVAKRDARELARTSETSEAIETEYLTIDVSNKSPSPPRVPPVHRNKFGTHFGGAGGRFCGSLSAPDKLIFDAGQLVNSYEEVAQRPEMCPLAPIMFLPSTDADVVMMQKELLERQRKIQVLQQELLQAQIDNLHRIENPQDRYEEEPAHDSS
ncbi:unnamed protein product, partial [Mesorhabditis spiculigera]